jgi:NADPH:quinone reductase-like Zn-dependent oxidoreductase
VPLTTDIDVLNTKALKLKVDMKAITRARYGTPELLKLEEVPEPEIGSDSILVRNHVSSLNAADAYLLRGKPFMVRLASGALLKPKQHILGADFAGEVVEVGANVHDFQVGDRVYGDNSDHGMGGFAEYIAVDPRHAVKISPGFEYTTVGTLPLASITALQGLRRLGPVREGEHVLINGASGGVGVFAVQMAKYFGAQVTGTCSSHNLVALKQLGADTVIDYQRTDVCAGRQSYDLILDIAAYRPMKDYIPILKPKGRYVLVGGSIARIIQMLLFSRIAVKRNEISTSVLSASSTPEDLDFINARTAHGELLPVIAHVYPLSDIRHAFEHFMSGRKFGKIAIKITN